MRAYIEMPQPSVILVRAVYICQTSQAVPPHQLATWAGNQHRGIALLSHEALTPVATPLHWARAKRVSEQEQVWRGRRQQRQAP